MKDDCSKESVQSEQVFDCGMEMENYWFRYRTGAIIVNDGKMLFVKSMYGGYYYMLGGGVHLGETSEECIEREVYEETGLRCKARRIAITCENFFIGRGGKIDGKECHELEYYYLMDITDDSCSRSDTDESEKLVWVPIEDFGKCDIRPAFLKEKLKEVIDGGPLIHVISDERPGKMVKYS
jgi:8-oxo-dGTP pyrophosphatase MutT (NUDIX family)